jgi:hypothetical protein
LIKLPADATVKYTAKIFGYDIVWRHDLTPKTARREAERAAAKYRAIKLEDVAGKTQFIDMFPLPGGGVVLHRWKRPYSTPISIMECYFISQDARQQVFFYSPEIGVSSFEYSRQAAEVVAKTIYARDIGDPIPTEPGFAFEGGFIKYTGEWRVEDATVAFTLPAYPGIVGDFEAYGSGDVGEKMFDKGVDNLFFTRGIRSSIFTTLRKGDVTVDGRPAQELCRASTEEGRRTYVFRLEVPDQGEDMARPQLNLEFFPDGSRRYSPNNYGNGFASDAEAVEVWNAIRDSIRLRPGAV